MGWVAINCPQCGAPLPRIAIWRSVECGSCGALITRTESVVTRDSFRKALLRAREASGFDSGVLCGGERYHLIQSLGAGAISQVYLGERLGLLPFLATIKLSSAAAAADRYAREAQVLRELHSLDGGAAEIFLPLVLAHGVVQDHSTKYALVLRHPSGFWGSLAALNERFPQGLDPRHAVWIWRRMLAALAFIHRHGWRHGDVRPEHALVHPGDHGARLIGWASAENGADARAQATDLVRGARVVLVLLCGEKDADAVPDHVPAELARLVTQASQDEFFCRTQRAEGLDGLLRAAAREAFGPPIFVPLIV